MFKKPWKITEGFILGGVLVLAGLFLQSLIGPIDREDFLNPPFQYILAALFPVAVLAAFLLKKRVAFFRWLGSPDSAVASIAWTMILTIVMGLTAQVPSRGWLGKMVTFRPFVFCYAWLTFVVGLVALNHIRRLGRSWKEVPAILNHLGLFIVLLCATLGSVDKRVLEMTLNEGETVSEAVAEDGTTYDTNLYVRLDDFTMETWPSGMPKRFASDVVVRDRTGKEMAGVIEVNKPLKVDGWRIYQYGYDEEAGVKGTTSILQFVKDPWLPYVMAGIFMMLAGAFLMMVTGFKKEEEA